MLEQLQAVAEEQATDYVAFQVAGEEATGVFRCAACGYGICIRGALPSCPMCAQTVWEVDPAATLACDPPLAR